MSFSPFTWGTPGGKHPLESDLEVLNEAQVFSEKLTNLDRAGLAREQKSSPGVDLWRKNLAHISAAMLTEGTTTTRRQTGGHYSV